jgi:biopolymer transport protein ExbD
VITRRRERLKPLVPIASMGDIAFLLIIFFMLTSNFIKEAHVDLTPPKSEDIEIIRETHVSISVDRDGLIWLQGKPCHQDLLENATEALLSDRKEKVVMVKIDKDLTEETFRPVLMALSRAGAEIALVGTKAR